MAASGASSRAGAASSAASYMPAASRQSLSRSGPGGAFLACSNFLRALTNAASCSVGLTMRPALAVCSALTAQLLAFSASASCVDRVASRSRLLIVMSRSQAYSSLAQCSFHMGSSRARAWAKSP